MKKKKQKQPPKYVPPPSPPAPEIAWELKISVAKTAAEELRAKAADAKKNSNGDNNRTTNGNRAPSKQQKDPTSNRATSAKSATKNPAILVSNPDEFTDSGEFTDTSEENNKGGVSDRDSQHTAIE